MSLPLCIPTRRIKPEVTMNVSTKATLTSSRTKGSLPIRTWLTVTSKSKKRCQDRFYHLCAFYTFFSGTFGIPSSGHRRASPSAMCRPYSACSRYCCRRSLPAGSAGQATPSGLLPSWPWHQPNCICLSMPSLMGSSPSGCCSRFGRCGKTFRPRIGGLG